MLTQVITLRRFLMLGTAAAAMSFPAAVAAQSQTETPPDVESETEEADDNVIVVRGIRESLAAALDQKRLSDNIVEVINAEDVGKLPDQNLAEVLENVTGIQLDRSLGVGTQVSIRGTGDNRIEINGNSTTPAGANRTGINFQDLPAALIASVEVTKVPTAKTIEGSVGGTINLKTYRGLDLKERLISGRADGEYSDLTKEWNPRISGTIGDKFDLGDGEIGIVLSGSYIEQDVASFDPRFDRDRVATPGQTATPQTDPFFRTQFLQQTIARRAFETLSFSGSVEYAPTSNFKLFIEGTYTDQEEAQRNAEVQSSGTGSGPSVANSTYTGFETINLGSIDGPNGTLNLGSVTAGTTGIINVAANGNGRVLDPNLRTVIGTSSRLTESYVLAGGFEWEFDRLTAVVEGQRSRSTSTFPGLRVTLDFINPNSRQPNAQGQLDNGTPVAFDATGRTLQFGIAEGLAETPTSAQLLDPANYAFRLSQQTLRETQNTENAFRIDLNLDTEDLMPFFTSFDFGVRFNETTSTNANSNDAFSIATSGLLANNGGGLTSRPTADQFSSIIIAGPDNFGDADGRTLFFRDYLIVDPDLAFDDPDAVIAALNAAGLPISGVPSLSQTSVFDISEETLAAYFQGNYEADVFGVPIRGNIGFRWISTDVTAEGITVAAGVPTEVSLPGSYTEFLPRWNIVAEPANNFLLRGGIARDIRRPNFDELSPSTNFPLNAAGSVSRGNPVLNPETVWSFDVAAEYYFSETGFLSVGLFHKIRDNIVVATLDPTFEDPTTGFRSITEPCPGGIFNPVAQRGIFSPDNSDVGICVNLESFQNTQGTQIQQGIEVAFQYDLANFEDTLGFLSGFGVLANFTYQRGTTADNFFDATASANALNEILGRTDANGATPTLDDDIVQQRIPLAGLSDISYNLTLFYEKYGLSARARYSYRSDFYSFSTLNNFGLPLVIDDRAQLNANISYEVTPFFTIAAEGINLLREDRTAFCINDEALLCEQGLTDRRFTVGARFKF